MGSPHTHWSAAEAYLMLEPTPGWCGCSLIMSAPGEEVGRLARARVSDGKNEGIVSGASSGFVLDPETEVSLQNETVVLF